MRTRTSARIVIDVLGTLFKREWRQRLARGRWLTLWTFLEPLLQIFAIGALYTAYGKATIAGQEAYLFLGVGIFSFLSFRSLATKPSDAIVVSAGLLSYRQVHVLDLLLTKWGAEALTYVVLAFLGMLYMALFEDTLEVKVGQLALGLGTMLSLSLSLTCLLAWGRKLRPWITVYYRPVLFGFYISSGALHPVWDLPEWVTNLLAYNPMVLVIELLRQSLLYHYVSPLDISTAYLLIWALGSLLLGLSVVMRNGESLRTR
jgi:capsular polysaccharide transport system permease protein